MRHDENEFSSRRFLPAVMANLGHGEAALGDYLLEGNAAFRVLPEVVTRSGDGASFSKNVSIVFSSNGC
jgi:hypothetical protein